MARMTERSYNKYHVKRVNVKVVVHSTIVYHATIIKQLGKR